MRYESQGSRRRGHPDSATGALARGLGWFSIGLGLFELGAPRFLARQLGMEGNEGLIRAYGAREIASGFAILAAADPMPGVWARVAGDAMDLATLATGLDADNPQKGSVMLAMAAVGGVTALDVYCATTLTGESPRPLPPPRDYSRRVGMPRSPGEMRGAARDFEVPPISARPRPCGPGRRHKAFAPVSCGFSLAPALVRGSGRPDDSGPRSSCPSSTAGMACGPAGGPPRRRRARGWPDRRGLGGAAALAPTKGRSWRALDVEGQP